MSTSGLVRSRFRTTLLMDGRRGLLTAGLHAQSSHGDECQRGDRNTDTLKLQLPVGPQLVPGTTQQRREHSKTTEPIQNSRAHPWSTEGHRYLSVLKTLFTVDNH